MTKIDTRINLTLDIETFNIVNTLAELRGLTRSALLREFITASTPALEASITMMELVKNADPEKMAAIAKMLDEAEKNAGESMGSVQSFLDGDAESK